MSDSDKPDPTITPPAPDQATPATPAAEATKATDQATSPAPAAEGAKAPPPAPAKGAKPQGKKPGGGGFGGPPRRRMREPMPALDEPRFQAGPRLKDLDAEIEDEMAAALAGMGGQDLMAAETSEAVRHQAG